MSDLRRSATTVKRKAPPKYSSEACLDLATSCCKVEERKHCHIQQPEPNHREPFHGKRSLTEPKLHYLEIDEKVQDAPSILELLGPSKSKEQHTGIFTKLVRQASMRFCPKRVDISPPAGFVHVASGGNNQAPLRPVRSIRRSAPDKSSVYAERTPLSPRSINEETPTLLHPPAYSYTKTRFSESDHSSARSSLHSLY